MAKSAIPTVISAIHGSDCTDIGEKHGNTEKHQRNGNSVQVLHLWASVHSSVRPCAVAKLRITGEGPRRAWRVSEQTLRIILGSFDGGAPGRGSSHRCRR